MAENEVEPGKPVTGFQIPTTVITGLIIAVVVGVTYVFFGPEAAKSVCNAVM